MLAIGNSDVPVGQYTQKIFAFYGLEETAIGSCLTYGSNVKEVTTQVSGLLSTAASSMLQTLFPPNLRLLTQRQPRCADRSSIPQLL